ncbi:MAG: hypothetical protein JW838_01250 [Spirochaetes bacterium]|nr:hypothetical protein [Spirochaetota bacterium]
MKQNILAIIMAAALLIAAERHTSGLGLGLSMKDDPPGMPQAPEVTFSSPMARLTHSLTGLDFVMDTAVARDRLFNYRLTIECANFTRWEERLFSSRSYQVNRLLWANTFGFGIVRTRLMRIWVGPQVALSYEFKNRDRAILGSAIYTTVGPVVGANINTWENVTLGFELGFRTGLVAALERPIAGIRPEPMASMRLIFRGGETYSPGAM